MSEFGERKGLRTDQPWATLVCRSWRSKGTSKEPAGDCPRKGKHPASQVEKARQRGGSISRVDQEN